MSNSGYQNDVKHNIPQTDRNWLNQLSSSLARSLQFVRHVVVTRDLQYSILVIIYMSADMCCEGLTITYFQPWGTHSGGSLKTQWGTGGN